MNMKKLPYSLPFFLFLTASLLLLSGHAVAANKPIDSIIAIVNEDIVTENELTQRIVLLKKQLADQNINLPPEPQLKDQLLDRMIIEAIQLQIADRAGIRISDSELNETITNIARQEEMSLTQFREQLIREGYNYNQFRDMIRRELIMGRLQQRQVGPRVVVTEQEINNFENSPAGRAKQNSEYLVGHILISLSTAPTPAQLQNAQDTAQSILTELRTGADFQQTAITRSQSQEALSGGDLGWRTAPELPTFLADDILKMEVGDIAGPIRSSNGLHIIKLLGARIDKAEAPITQTRVRHVLVRVDSTTTDEQAQQKIEAALTKINQGESFAQAAKDFSDDTVSAENGGDLGWVSPGDLVPEFETVMNESQLNEVSKPFKSDYGWHILEVNERRQVDQGEAGLKKQIQQYLFRTKFEEALQGWLREIYDQSYVEKRL